MYFSQNQILRSIWRVNLVIGLAMVAGYALTLMDLFVSAGIIWILWGLFSTLFCIVAGWRGLVRNQSLKRYILLHLLNFPVGIFCAIAGATMAWKSPRQDFISPDGSHIAGVRNLSEEVRGAEYGEEISVRSRWLGYLSMESIFIGYCGNNIKWISNSELHVICNKSGQSALPVLKRENVKEIRVTYEVQEG